MPLIIFERGHTQAAIRGAGNENWGAPTTHEPAVVWAWYACLAEKKIHHFSLPLFHPSRVNNHYRSERRRQISISRRVPASARTQCVSPWRARRGRGDELRLEYQPKGAVGRWLIRLPSWLRSWRRRMALWFVWQWREEVKETEREAADAIPTWRYPPLWALSVVLDFNCLLHELRLLF